MNKAHVKYLICPECNDPLNLIYNELCEGDRIESGALRCSKCNIDYPIIRSIPRFVDLENYASGFGFQWIKHSKTQYDSFSGANLSEKRFFEETKWARELNGEVILEVGSGSGRFTEQAASTGAMVVSMDYSIAVEANFASNGHKDNVLIVQGDIYNMPFKKEFFDKLFCIGVLQHTPDVKKAFYKLPLYLKSRGSIVVDCYKKYPAYIQIFLTKYWIRPITKRIRPELLYKITSTYVKLMWPLSKIIRILPYGRNINWLLFVADYKGMFDLEDKMLRQWAVLDTFDMLSPAYDYPQSIDTIEKWFKDNDLTNIDIHYGYNGIEARALRL